MTCSRTVACVVYFLVKFKQFFLVLLTRILGLLESRVTLVKTTEISSRQLSDKECQKSDTIGGGETKKLHYTPNIFRSEFKSVDF